MTFGALVLGCNTFHKGSIFIDEMKVCMFIINYYYANNYVFIYIKSQTFNKVNNLLIVFQLE